jgi:hypothetical protein
VQYDAGFFLDVGLAPGGITLRSLITQTLARQVAPGSLTMEQVDIMPCRLSSARRAAACCSTTP